MRRETKRLGNGWICVNKYDIQLFIQGSKRES